MSSCSTPKLGGTPAMTGGRRRSKKTRRTRSRRHRRFRGGEFPSFQGAITGANGQPAGAMSSGYTVSTGSAVGASYEPPQGSASGSLSGGRRRTRRSRHRRSRHRMRGGTGGMGIGYGFQGNTIAGIRPEWGPSSTTTHIADDGYNGGFPR